MWRRGGKRQRLASIFELLHYQGMEEFETPKAPQIISEYEAAALVAMSPDLLRWLTSYAPKTGIKTKLKVAKKEKDGRLFYDREELLSFDAFLRQPWPAKSGKRPNLPSEIREEIRVEANGECAICCKHGNKCEAAHLEPVATTYSNHPENLLWLCANHHTSYDKGHYGPKDEDADFVGNYKKILRRYRVMQWQMQAELSIKLLTALESCALLSKQLENATTREQVAAVEAVAVKFLADLPSIAPVSKADKRYSQFEKISAEIQNLTSSSAPVKSRLDRAAVMRAEFVVTMGMVACPLCDATGVRDGGDCPVCGGDREVAREDLDRIELDQFAVVQCPLCEGEGTRNGEACTACGGDGEMERRQAEWIDIRDYSTVDCPICAGSRVYFGEECRACNGGGEMEKRNADMLDRHGYDVVDCPLCGGSGRYDGSDCPPCRGERKMLRRDADNIDLRDYDFTDCPVCEGTGRLRGDDCPACHAEGTIERRYLDRIDAREYALVDCPVCENDLNRRDECRACGGEGNMMRRHADQIDPREYR